jgi:Mn2+/Fe2+ NRAMP family transporter
MIVGLIGTTITPWMQFYLQASIVEKGVSKRDYGLSRLDVIFGCIVTDIIAFFIVVACAATIFHTQHREINDVAKPRRPSRRSPASSPPCCSPWDW